MRKLCIFRGARFRVFSYGNGLAYALENVAENRDVFFQGDDAATFRDDWRRAELAKPYRLIDAIMAGFWLYYSECSNACEVTP